MVGREYILFIFFFLGGVEAIDKQLKWSDDFLSVLLLVLIENIFSDWNVPDIQKTEGDSNDSQ